MIIKLIVCLIVIDISFIAGAYWKAIHSDRYILKSKDVIESFYKECNMTERCEECAYNNDERKTALNDVYCFNEFLKQQQIYLSKEGEEIE